MSEIDLVQEVPTFLLGRSVFDRVAWCPSIGQAGLHNVLSQTAVHLVGLMVEISQRARDTAFSWRNYDVGAAVVGFNFWKRELGIMSGANYKPQRGGGLNLHAEQVAIRKAREAQLGFISGLMIQADPNDNDANPRSLPTLPPCGRCDMMIRGVDEIMGDTLVMTANPDASVCEMYFVDEVHDYYAVPEGRKPKRISDGVPVFSAKDYEDLKFFNHEILTHYVLPRILQRCGV